jgi:phage terminase small subunit
MPTLAKQGHEAFCQHVASGKSRIAAYVEAGYKHNHGNAATLHGKPHIKARIAEIQCGNAQLLAIDAAISKQWVLDCLRQNALKALKTEGGSNIANRALELIGRELGMFLERQERGKPGDFSHLSDEELDAALAEKLTARGMTPEQVERFLNRSGVPLPPTAA